MSFCSDTAARSCSTTATVRSPSSIRTANFRRFFSRLRSVALITSSRADLARAKMINDDAGADRDLPRLELVFDQAITRGLGNGDEVRRRRHERHARYHRPDGIFLADNDAGDRA